jgi:DmsE family decaheme c-type cytochrome
VSALLGLLGAGSGLALAAEPAKSAEPAKDLILKGDAKCTGCHDEADDAKPTMIDLHPSVLAIGKTKHGVRGDSRTPTCTDCHGESEKHLVYRGKDTPPLTDRDFRKKTSTPSSELNQACQTCHKGGTRTHWEGSQHQIQDVACTGCHQVHTQNDKVRDKRTQPEVCFTCHKDQRVDSRKMSHHPIVEGKVACSDCHNAHGSAAPKSLKKNTLNETCFICHAEKRGPFLWEHQPATEDCSTCHTSHGSNITPLLKSRAPFMCQECHDGPHASKSPVARNAAGTQGGLTAVPSETVTGRGCMNCHNMVHGSNSPAGAILTR